VGNEARYAYELQKLKKSQEKTSKLGVSDTAINLMIEEQQKLEA